MLQELPAVQDIFTLSEAIFTVFLYFIKTEFLVHLTSLDRRPLVLLRW